MRQPPHSCIRDALTLTGWAQQEIDRFIEANPMIWLQAIRMRVMDAVNHIEMFVATGTDTMGA